MPDLPPIEEKCSTVNCPANSHGLGVLHGCTCDAGHSGAILRSAEYPFFSGTCMAVKCPEHSTGSAVPSGCVCDPGYIGEIEATQEEPYYAGSCETTTSTLPTTSSTKLGFLSACFTMAGIPT
eukprot:s96_g4.t1